MVVAVGGNPAKTSGLLTVPERLTAVVAATAHIPNVRAMAAMNQHMSGVPTVFVRVHPLTRSISSSTIRALIAAGELDRAEQLVPPAVHAFVASPDFRVS